MALDFFNISGGMWELHLFKRNFTIWFFRIHFGVYVPVLVTCPGYLLRQTVLTQKMVWFQHPSMFFFEQRDLEKFMPLEHSKYFAPEYCIIPKRKGPCFFFKNHVWNHAWFKDVDVFKSCFFHFFAGVYHGVSPYVLSMFLL